jgi:hypothetical protein
MVGILAAATGLGMAFLAFRKAQRSPVRPPGRHAPRPVPQQIDQQGEPLQLTGDGVGELIHRRYWVDLADTRVSPVALIGHIKRDVAAFSPRLLARFRKTKGWGWRMAVGDEYHIEILGPWNGDVRVSEVSRNSFTFVTLRGHPEAGQIRFMASSLPGMAGGLRFEIYSWARSRDAMVYLGYNLGQIGKLVQRQVWINFCYRVAEASGGRMLGEVGVCIEELPIEGEVVRVV